MVLQTLLHILQTFPEHGCATDGNSRVLVIGCSLFRLPLLGATFLLWHCSSLSVSQFRFLFKLKPFSLFLPSLTYSKLLTGIRCCTEMYLYFVLEFIQGGWKRGMGGGGGGNVYGSFSWKLDQRQRGCRFPDEIKIKLKHKTLYCYISDVMCLEK